MSVNKVILIGNLGQDPELRYTPSGQAVGDLRIATNERWTSRDGQQQERTEWHRIVVWGKDAENAEKFLAKGRQVYIEGRLQTRQWEDRDGNKRYTTEIVAQRLVFLSSGRSGGRAGGSDEPPPPRDYDAPGHGSPPVSDPDDDIPF